MSYKDYLESSQASTRSALFVLTTLNVLGAVIFFLWMQFDKAEAVQLWNYFGWIIPWVTVPINIVLALICLLGLDGPSEVDKLIMRGEQIMKEQGKR